jgi:hypothetical protein
MEDMMFATVLYVGMICFVCCLRYQPNCAATVEAATTEQVTDESQLTDINQGSTAQPEQKPELANIVLKAEASSRIPMTCNYIGWSEAGDGQPTSLSTNGSPLNSALDPSKLTLRQCRAVIREINKGLAKQDRIRQKINGKDAPSDWLRGQIARYLEIHADEENFHSIS